MRKIQILGAAFFAVLAFGALSASSALATHEWLVGGKLVLLTEKIGAVTKGTWLLLAEGFGGFAKTHIICNGELLGTINGLNPTTMKGTDTVTEIHNLSLTELKKIDCEVLHSELGNCAGSLLALVTAIHLPWLTELILKTGDTKARDLFTSGGAGEPGFEVTCTTSGGATFKETCEGNVETGQLTNGAGGVEGEIPEQETKKCNGFGVKGHIKGKGELKNSLTAGVVSIS